MKCCWHKSSLDLRSHWYIIYKLGAILVTVTACSTQGKPQNAVPDPLPPIQDVVAAMDQNVHKISNLKVRSIVVTATSPGLWSEDQGKDTRLLVSGKEIQVRRSLGLLLDGKVFLDEHALKLTPTQMLEDERRYWFDKGRGIGYFSIDSLDVMSQTGQIERANRGVTTAYEDERPIVPFLALGKMQIAATTQDHSSLLDKGAQITGWQNFHGLNCIKVEYQVTNTNPYSGYALVCPQRDYKLVFNEQNSNSLDPKDRFKHSVDRFVVEQFAKYGDAWIPARVRHEWVRTTVDGQEKSLIEQFRVLEFQADAVTTDLLFEPLFAPGTRLYRNGMNAVGGKMEVVGGDVLSLVKKLQSGDFSILKENIEDLSKP